MAVARDAFHGFGAPLAIAAGALAVLALWTLASAAWSHALARALIEFDRVLLYLLALVTFGLVGRDPRRLRLMLYGVALGIAVVCGFAFVSRVAPDVWSAPSEFQNNRLSYPVTYWNALGLLAGLGIVLALHLTTDLREPRWLRVASAATVPMLGATILLTFSRGGIGACILGLAAYLLLGRPRGLVTGLVAIAPLTVVAVRAAYDATLLATTT